MTDYYTDICTECGKRKKVWLIREDVRLCDDCVEESDWWKCDVCGDFYIWDAVEWTDLPDGRTACEYCMEDINEL